MHRTVSSNARRLLALLMLAAVMPRTVDAQVAPARTIIKAQHVRLPFGTDIRRLAVGDTEILAADLLTSREVLLLGKDTGRTSLIVWFADGSVRELLISVQRDLSLLTSSLKRLDPSIEVESAPDRDALILTGLVPTLAVSQTAEQVVRNYLDAGETRRGAARPLMAARPAPVAVPPPDGVSIPADDPAPVPGPAASPRDAVQVQAQPGSPAGTVINLLRLAQLPPLPEERITEAIRSVGGDHVTVRRMMRGNLRDDARDALVLEGRVPNQVALVRVLSLAAQLFASKTITAEDIHVLADESGGLSTTDQTQTQQPLTSTAGGNSVLSTGRGLRLTNQLRRNLGRATAVEVADGRVLSFIDVVDLPQIRVNIRLLEVDRTKLRSFTPTAAVLGSSFRQQPLSPAAAATTVQGDRAARVGSEGSAIQNVLAFLGGGLLNQTQFSGGRAAIDAAVALLEREGIARSLSSPTVTVLSGEVAQVQVGGEVPIPVAFTPTFSASSGSTTASATAGVFSAVEFVPYGIQLGIRPLVGDDDTITLDMQPVLVTPDTTLTNAIRESTGASVATTAFQTRALRTSARLQDGQGLLVGGLTTRTASANTASTPKLRDTPLIGNLFREYNQSDETTELVVVVNPVVVRPPVSDLALWAFPPRHELLRSVLGGRPTSPAP